MTPRGAEFSKNFVIFEFPAPKSFSGEIFMKIGAPRFLTVMTPKIDQNSKSSDYCEHCYLRRLEYGKFKNIGLDDHKR